METVLDIVAVIAGAAGSFYAGYQRGRAVESMRWTTAIAAHVHDADTALRIIDRATDGGLRLAGPAPGKEKRCK